MKVNFTVWGEPKGKGRPRFSTVGKYAKAYTPAETASYENLVKVEYCRQCKNAKFEDGSMLDLRVFAYYAIPKSVSKKKRKLMLDKVIRPTKKPDMDNIIKIIADMTVSSMLKFSRQQLDRIPCKVNEVIDTIISHNAIVGLWVQDENENHCSKRLWQGMAWDIPEKYKAYVLVNIFGTIAENIYESDVVNIKIKEREDKTNEEDNSDTYNNNSNDTVDGNGGGCVGNMVHFSAERS